MKLALIGKYCIVFLIVGSLGIAVWSQIQREKTVVSEKNETVLQTSKKIGSENSIISSQNQQKHNDWSEYESVRERISLLSNARDLYGLADLEEEVETTWGKTQPIDIFGRNLYAGLMYNICGSFASQDFNNDKQYVLARKCTKKALEKRDNMLIQQEIDLVSFLSGTTEYALNLVSEKEWESDRKERAEYWLHAWQRLENEIDKNYNFEANRPINRRNLTSEEKAKIETYTKQSILHKLKGNFLNQLKDFLIGAYTMSPYKNPELESFLKKFVSEGNLKEYILSRVKYKISKNEKLKLENKQPNS